jgi:hypothetical protein
VPLRLDEKGQDAVAALFRALKDEGVAGTFVDDKLSARNPAGEVATGGERHEGILGTVMNLNRQRGEARPARVTGASEELQRVGGGDREWLRPCSADLRLFV